MPLDVLRARDEDVPYLSASIAALNRHLADSSDSVLLEGLPRDAGEGELSYARERVSSDQAVALVAWLDEQRVGCLLADVRKPDRGFRERPVGHISVVWVEPGVRRAGVARELVSRAERELFALGMDLVQLNYFVGNREARGTWERLGYEPFSIYATKKRRDA